LFLAELVEKVVCGSQPNVTELARGAIVALTEFLDSTLSSDLVSEADKKSLLVLPA
jgi:hypothetical protein